MTIDEDGYNKTNLVFYNQHVATDIKVYALIKKENYISYEAVKDTTHKYASVNIMKVIRDKTRSNIEIF